MNNPKDHKYFYYILNEFLAALFTQEVPEIYDGIIKIKGVAREPGSRAKISAFSMILVLTQLVLV